MLGRPRLFDPGCDLVLEAFPRSGNTYALRMLQFSQRKELVIRTHRHVPPLVLSALRIGKPVLLLVRPPRDAVPSWQLYTGLPLEYVLRQYLLFHRILLPHRDAMQVETFDDVTRDFRGVVERLERRFRFGLSTAFDEEKCRADAMEHIDSHRRLADGRIDVLRVNRPDAERAAQKERLLREQRSPRIDALFGEAETLYARLASR